MAKSGAIRGFLRQLPHVAAAKLLSAVDSGALPAEHLGLSEDEVRDCLKPDRPEFEQKRDASLTPIRLFCAPFEDFLIDAERDEKVAGLIPRGSAEKVWIWVQEDLLTDTFPDMLGRVHAHIESGDMNALAASVRVMQEAAGAAMTDALDRSETGEARFDAIVRKLGEFKVLEDAREIADVFAILDEMSEMQIKVPRKISTFDERMVSEVRDIYEELYERDPDRAIYLALAVMGRLDEPWQILRLARKIAHKQDDTMISKTDFSILGERLIRRLEIISSYFQRLRPGLSDLDELFALIVEFSELSKGITKEISLLRIGNWGQRLLMARNVISTAIGDEFAHYPKDLGASLPLTRIGGFGRSGPRRVDVTHLPDEEKRARIMRELTFMSDLNPYAQSIGAQNAFDKIRPELELYLVTYEDAIVEELRYSDADAAENAEAFLAFAAEIIELMHGDSASSTLLKRGRVALQASA